MANINSEDVGNRNKNEIFNGIKVIYINKRYTSASSIESGKNIFNNIWIGYSNERLNKLNNNIKFNVKKIPLPLLDDDENSNKKKDNNQEEKITSNEIISTSSEREITKSNLVTYFEYKIINKTDVKLFKLINSYIFRNNISDNLIQSFLFTSIPENYTLQTNLKIKRKCIFPLNDNNTIFNYDYEQELISNNKIFLIGKITKIIKKIKVKIYMTSDNKIYKYLGKIESNILRNKFTFYLGDNKKNYNKNIIINYEINFLGLSGLRNLNIITYNNNNKFKNKKPIWSFQFKKFELDFNKRVRLRHYNNFILENEEKISVLQCGKIEKNIYALDFQFPFTPIQAFVIGISSVINKITC